MIPCLAAVLVAQEQLSAGPNLSLPPQVAGAVRLAKSPTLDGRIEPEEWDAFAVDGPPQNSFQWEPDHFHWAVHVPPGQEAVLTLDQNADGWLVGSDNLEVRVGFAGGLPQVQARVLDASTPGQPQWRPASFPTDQIRIAAAPASDGGMALESTFVPNLGRGPQAGRRSALRIDTVAQGRELTEVYAPRALASVFLQFDSSENLPMGISWRPVVASRSTAYLDRLRLGFSLKREEGEASFTRVEARGEGSARTSLAEYSQPAPPFDGKGRLEAPYESVIAQGAPVGWRVIRATFKGVNSEDFVLRTSVRIADLLDMELGFPPEGRASAEAQIIRGSVTLRSQFTGRLQGTFTMVAPAEWTVTKGKDRPFLIYHTKGSARVPVEFVIPRGQSGVFPITFKAQMGERTVERRIYYALEP